MTGKGTALQMETSVVPSSASCSAATTLTAQSRESVTEVTIFKTAERSHRDQLRAVAYEKGSLPPWHCPESGGTGPGSGGQHAAIIVVSTLPPVWEVCSLPLRGSNPLFPSSQSLRSPTLHGPAVVRTVLPSLADSWLSAKPPRGFHVPWGRRDHRVRVPLTATHKGSAGKRWGLQSSASLPGPGLSLRGSCPSVPFVTLI